MLEQLITGTDTSALQVCLHANQQTVYHSPARFRILVAGRRFGKSELALAEIFRAATAKPNQLCWYVAPQKEQAEDIAWPRLKEITKHLWASRPNESHKKIHLTNGSLIVLKSAFNPDGLRGRGLNFVAVDEFAYIKPEVWADVFRPALADRLGGALFMSTPKGRNHVFDFYEYAQTQPDWACFQFTTEDGGIVSPAELQKAGNDMDANTYRREFLAEFGSVGAYRTYYAFDRANNVKDVRFDENHPLVWSLDFNVDPMTMLIMQKIGDMIHVLEEIIIKPDANTDKACQAFHHRMQTYYYQMPFRQRPLHLRIYGDASGHQRRTAGTQTDWTIIKNFFTLWVGTYQPQFFNANVNPLVRDRVNCVNARLNNQWNEQHLFIHPSCKELIRDLEEVSWEVDRTGRPTNDLNKSDRTRTHASDALGYFVSEVFSLKPTIGEKNKRLFW